MLDRRQFLGALAGTGHDYSGPHRGRRGGRRERPVRWVLNHQLGPGDAARVVRCAGSRHCEAACGGSTGAVYGCLMSMVAIAMYADAVSMVCMIANPPTILYPDNHRSGTTVPITTVPVPAFRCQRSGHHHRHWTGCVRPRLPATRGVQAAPPIRVIRNHWRTGSAARAITRGKSKAALEAETLRRKV